MKCPDCGAELSPNARFCRECGRRVSAAVAPASERVKCANCQADLKPGARFCEACGHPVAASEPPPPAVCANCRASLAPDDQFCSECGQPVAPRVKPTAPPSRRRRIPGWVWVGVLAVAILAVALVLVNSLPGFRVAIMPAPPTRPVPTAQAQPPSATPVPPPTVDVAATATAAGQAATRAAAPWLTVTAQWMTATVESKATAQAILAERAAATGMAAALTAAVQATREAIAGATAQAEAATARSAAATGAAAMVVSAAQGTMTALAISNAQATAAAATSAATTPPPTPAPRTPTIPPTPTTPATPPPPEPSAPGRVHGHIAVSAFAPERGTYDIYVANADGSDLRRVLDLAAQPSLRPDGLQIAFRRWKDDDRGVEIMDTYGGNQRRLTNFLEDALPAWSPNGKTLVFFSRRESDRKSRIYVVNAVGGGDWELKRDGGPVFGEYPTWLANGQIVYRAVWPEQGIVVMNADGAAPRMLFADGSATAPAGSPDGRYVAFMSLRDGNWEVYRVNLDGAGLLRLTNSPGNDGLPTWSPDGAHIAFASDREGGWAVWVMSANGSGQRKLFPFPGSPEGYVVREPEFSTRGWVEERISWGP